MIFVVVGIALFLFGLIVGLVGPKLGTALACLPPVLFFALLIRIQLDGELDSAGTADLGAGLLFGLLAFITGTNLTERGAALRTRRRRMADGD